jgi:hypothetical protein
MPCKALRGLLNLGLRSALPHGALILVKPAPKSFTVHSQCASQKCEKYDMFLSSKSSIQLLQTQPPCPWNSLGAVRVTNNRRCFSHAWMSGYDLRGYQVQAMQVGTRNRRLNCGWCWCYGSKDNKCINWLGTIGGGAQSQQLHHTLLSRPVSGQVQGVC